MYNFEWQFYHFTLCKVILSWNVSFEIHANLETLAPNDKLREDKGLLNLAKCSQVDLGILRNTLTAVTHMEVI